MRSKLTVAVLIGLLLSLALLSRQSKAADDAAASFEYQVMPDPTDPREG